MNAEKKTVDIPHVYINKDKRMRIILESLLRGPLKAKVEGGMKFH